MSDRQVGMLWSLTSAFCWGTNFIAGRYLLSNSLVDPVTLSGVRFFIGGVLLLVIGSFLYRDELFSISLKDFVKIGALALIGMVVMSTLQLTGQKYTTATNGSLIMQLNPIMISVMSIFIGERIRFNNIIGLLLSFLGCLVFIEVITPSGIIYNTENNYGDFLVFLSAACWAIYSILAKPLVLRLGGYAVTTWVMLFGSIEFLILSLVMPIEIILVHSSVVWAVILYVSIFPSALAFLGWLKAMEKIPLSFLNIMQYLSPVFTIILAGLILGERLKIVHGVGIALIVSGIYISEFLPQTKWFQGKLTLSNK